MANRKKIEKFEIVVIGAGPGGYAAALRAAQLGQDVLLVEKQNFGGACLNEGCIPSKALLEAAAIKQQIISIEKQGHIHTGVNLDMAKLLEWKNGFCEKLQNNVESLLAKKNVTIVKGTAAFSTKEQITVISNGKSQKFKFEYAILATGAQPRKIGRYKIDHKILLTLSDALLLSKICKNLIILGSDIMGLEIATIWQKLGTHVTILATEENLLPNSEPEIDSIILNGLKKIGCTIFQNVQDFKLQKNSNNARVEFKSAQEKHELITDAVIVNVGHVPNTFDLNLEKVGIEADSHGYIAVDDKLRSANPNIYAVGDIVKGMRRAYRASFMGKFVADSISGSTLNYSECIVPDVVFSDPEVVSVGMTEKQAKKKGHKPISKIFPYRTHSKYITFGQIDGLTKVIIDKNSHRVLGVHMIGPHAFQRIAESRLAVQNHFPIEKMIFNVSDHHTTPMDVRQMTDILEKNAINIFMPAQTGSPVIN